MDRANSASTAIRFLAPLRWVPSRPSDKLMPRTGGGLHVSRHRIAIGLVVATALACGCASSELTNSRSAIHSAERLPRPGQVIVYDFAVTPEAAAKRTAEEITALLERNFAQLGWIHERR